MTVDQLKEKLEALSNSKGSDNVVLEIKSQNASIGATPHVKISGIYSGFDWDNGKVFLDVDGSLFLVDESFKKSKKINDTNSSNVYKIKRYYRDESLSDSKKLENIGKVLGLC